MVSTEYLGQVRSDFSLKTCICSSMRGDTKFKVPKAGNGNLFFPNKRVIFARADKAVALQYNYQ